MILILEGPDGAGKTTLAEALRHRLQHDRMVHLVKHGPYSGVQAEHLARIYFRGMSPALTFDDHVIMDRSWLSEPINGRVYRDGTNRVDVERKRMLERAALSRGAVVVHCQPDFEVCAKAFSSREDAEYLDNLDQLRKVWEEYDSLPMSTDLPTVLYDYTTQSVDELMALIYKAHEPYQNHASGGGAFKQGNILMLCDRGPRTNMRASAVVIPFVNFLDNDGPSRMLAQTLDYEHVRENQLYWINTQTYQGTPVDAGFISRLKPSKIYALGNNAYTWAINNGVKATKLPPPLHHMQNYPDQPYCITETAHGNTDD